LFLGSAQVAATLVNIVRNKLLAITLGPTGVGLLAQLQTVQNFLTILIPLGMQTAVLKYLAEYRGKDRDLVSTYFVSSWKAFAVVAVLVIAICLAFVKPLASLAIGDSKLYAYLIPALLGVPFIIQFQLSLIYLQAGMEFKSYAKINIATAIVGVTVLVPMVVMWKEVGAAAGLLCINAINFTMSRIFASRSMDSETKAAMKSARFDSRILWNLFRFAMCNLPMLIIVDGLPFVLRSTIIADSGLRANGIYQVLFMFSVQYLGIPLNALAAYATPRLCQAKDGKELNEEINANIKAAILVVTATIFAILLTRDFAVNLLFSGRFMEAVDLFPWQMIGDFFRASAFPLLTAMLALEKFRARNLITIPQYGLYLFVFFAVPQHLRLQGATWGHAVSWAFGFVCMYLYLNRSNGYTLGNENRRLILVSMLSLAAVAFMPFSQLPWRLAGAAVAACWLMLCVSGSDRKKLITAAKKRLGGNDKE
jgi:PST family polysaccharide transporter